MSNEWPWKTHVDVLDIVLVGSPSEISPTLSDAICRRGSGQEYYLIINSTPMSFFKSFLNTIKVSVLPNSVSSLILYPVLLVESRLFLPSLCRTNQRTPRTWSPKSHQRTQNPRRYPIRSWRLVCYLAWSTAKW